MSVIYFSNVRVSFPNLTAPYVSRKFPTAPANFTVDLVNIDPQDPKLAEFFKDYAAQAAATWGATAPQVMQMIKADKRARCFGMGAEKVNEETFKPLEGYGDGVWINAKNKNQPQMIRPDGTPAANAMEAMELARKIYGGCYVNVALSPWLRLANKGVSCNLIAVQFAKDGEAFGSSAPDVAPMFGAVLGNAPTGGFAPASAPAFAMPELPSFL